jgi:exosortase E/protease (VPEID-CTERM system)
VSAISSASAFVAQTATRQKHELALVSLLLAETLYLTVTLDTQPLLRMPSIWAALIGWAPQYLRLAIAIIAVTSLLGGRRLIAAVISPRESVTTDARVRWLGVHALLLVTFASVSRVLFAAGPGVAAHPGLWATAWIVSVTLTIGSWALAVFPASHWRELARSFRTPIAIGIIAGTAVWTGGLISEGLWTRLAGYTFTLVSATLRLFYADVVSRPDQLIVGTSRFRVLIAPTCSGYEGIGLILAFLGVYLVAFRKDLRFPTALVLLPIGAVAIWLLNAGRIVALIAIGTSGWREVALGGFHSQAGWIVFNVLCLTFVAVVNRGGYFMKVSPAHAAGAAVRESDSTPAYLGPFVALLAVAMVTGAFSAGFDFLYPLRLVAVAAVLWSCRAVYRTVEWRGSLVSVAIGAVTFVIWMAMLPADLTGKDGWPAALQGMSAAGAVLWLAVRVIGYVLVTPLAEELAFRGYVMRRLIGADIDRVPLGAFRWLSFLGSSLLFGAFHGQLWLQGTFAGMVFAGALYRRRSLGDAVLAHATTNGLIACYVFVTGHWSVWS